MNDTPSPSDNVSSSWSAPARLTAVLVLVAVAVASAIGGVAWDRYVLMANASSRGRGPGFGQGGQGPGQGRQGPSGRPGSSNGRRRFSERMAQELGLTPAQQVRVDSIMSKQMRGIRRVTDAAQPSIDSLTREAQQAMDSILSPAQQVKVKELRGRGRGRGRPPMGDEPPPSRPPR